MTLTHLSLFSGLGMIDVAAELAGFETVGQCEKEDFQTSVLEKLWPGLPRWRDVHHVTGESVQDAGIQHVTLVSGGYPCTTFSLVGKREGDLTLAKQFVRVIREVRPRWALGENVYGHVTNGLDEVMWMLEAEGYSTWAYINRASDFGAPHQRARVFVVAYSGDEPSAQEDSPVFPIRVEGNAREGDMWRYRQLAARPDWPICPSGILGTNDGLADRVERSKALGGGCVPVQVLPILQAIADIENGLGPIEEARP